MVRTSLYEYFVFSSWSPTILSSSKASLFCARFPEDVQTGQAWSYYSAVFSRAAVGAAWGSVAFFSGVCHALRCHAKMRDIGFVLRFSSYRNGLWASSWKAGAAFSSFSHNVWGIGFLRLVKTTGECGTGGLRCLFDMAYLEVWMNKYKD